MKILVLNSGSSSQKSCLYDIGNTLPEHPPAPVWAGKIEWDGNQADVQVWNLQGDHLKDRVKVASRSNAIDQLLDTLWNGKLRVVSAPSEIAGVGHRIVHGGKDLGETIAIKIGRASCRERVEREGRAEARREKKQRGEKE